MDKTTLWTTEEMDILCKHYPYLGAAHIIAMLPGRSLSSIYKKARYLGIGAYRSKEQFISYLRENIGTKSCQQMADEIGCSEANIRYRIRTLSAAI